MEYLRTIDAYVSKRIRQLNLLLQCLDTARSFLLRQPGLVLLRLVGLFGKALEQRGLCLRHVRTPNLIELLA